MDQLCELCQAQQAEVVAEIPMCGERPRYPVCYECLLGLGDYVEKVVPL